VAARNVTAAWNNLKSVETVMPDAAAAVCMGWGGSVNSARG